METGGATVYGGAVVGGTTGDTVVVVGDTAPSPGDTNNEYANRLGLPAPTFDNAPTVALAIDRFSTSLCVNVGSASSIKATMPLTSGAAFEVPLLERYTLGEPIHPATTSEPGAKRSTHGP